MNDLLIAKHHAEIMEAVYDRINNVHKRPLHPGQVKVAKDYFTRGISTCMSQCGRNYGKTECILYLATVACLLSENFLVMIITPELKQGKKIYWTPKRLQNYPPPQFVKSFGTSELKVEFNNGSVIQIDGCENYDSLRGVKPNFVIYDEFQDHSKEFHLEVMEPNLLGKNSSLFVFGTPPKSRSAYYVEFREELIKRVRAGDATASYYEFPTSVNPSVDPEKLQVIRKRLIESGNEVIWQREYEGRISFGGEDVVFPKWEPKHHVRSHAVTMSYLENDKHKLKWFTICDPGTSVCFGVLFAAYNPMTQQVFILDEIYEKDRKRTHTSLIWERIRKKEQELYSTGDEKSWRRIYDEQAAWFGREIAANYHVGLIPTQKYSAREDDGIARLKMMMAQANALTVSDRCYWLRWEIESYITDDNGGYIDKNNHLLDCTRYLIHACNWKMLEKAESNLIGPDHNVPVKKAQEVEIEDWATNIVEGSLWGDPNDYF